MTKKKDSGWKMLESHSYNDDSILPWKLDSFLLLPFLLAQQYQSTIGQKRFYQAQTYASCIGYSLVEFQRTTR